MTTRPSAASAAMLVAMLALSGCASTAGDDADMPGMDHDSSAAVDANEDDIEFATTMIAHHEQAIEASEIVADKDDVDPSVTELADRIRVAYKTDVDQLETWLDEWHDGAGGASEDAGEDAEDEDDSGMITDADLDALRAASGSDASILYLQQMIDDHEAAVDIAEEHIEEGGNPGAIDLSKKIVATEQLEIDRIKEILDGLQT